MRPELQKKKDTKKPHSCYAAKLRGRQQTKPDRLKTFTWFSAPARPAEKQECKQKEDSKTGKSTNSERICGCGRGQGGGGGRERGRGRLFLSLQTVYITKEESLEHNRAVPWATAQPALSCCQSLAAAVLSRTVRVFQCPIWLEDYSKACLTYGRAFGKQHSWLKALYWRSAWSIHQPETAAASSLFLVVNRQNGMHGCRLDVAASGAETDLTTTLNTKTRSAAENTLVQENSLVVPKFHQVKTSFSFVAYKKKKKKEKWFHIEELHNSWEQCGKSGQCWQSLVGLSTLQWINCSHSLASSNPK